MKTNAAAGVISRSFPVFASFSTIAASFESPLNSTGLAPWMISIFGWRSTFSMTTLLALSFVSRVMIVTLLAKRVRKRLSSPAELPPPMTHTSFCL